MAKKTIFQAIDQKLELQNEKLAAQLRLQKYQVSLAEEAKHNKEFQDRIKNLVFDIRKKAESLIDKTNEPVLKAAVGMFALNVFNKYSLSASNFNEIADKEYFHATQAAMDSAIEKAKSDQKVILAKAVNAYNHLAEINQMEADYQLFDNGKSKIIKWVYLILYVTLCVITIIGIPLLFFTKKVGRWAEGAQYKRFRGIATLKLDVKKLPDGFFKNYFNKHTFTGQYPELKGVKNLNGFNAHCDGERLISTNQISEVSNSIPGIENIAAQFI